MDVKGRVYCSGSFPSIHQCIFHYFAQQATVMCSHHNQINCQQNKGYHCKRQLKKIENICRNVFIKNSLNNLNGIHSVLEVNIQLKCIAFDCAGCHKVVTEVTKSLAFFNVGMEVESFYYTVANVPWCMRRRGCLFSTSTFNPLALVQRFPIREAKIGHLCLKNKDCPIR